MDTLLRIHASPVPTQITFGFFGSMVIAPIDWTGCRSKTGLNVVPPLTDFQTPPLAAPTYTVSRAPSCTAAIAAIRPLIAADPMLRAPNPEIISESTVTGAGCCARRTRDTPPHITVTAHAARSPTREFVIARILDQCEGVVAPTAGRANRPSSMETFASTRWYVTFDLSWLPRRPVSNEKGRYHPATAL